VELPFSLPYLIAWQILNDPVITVRPELLIIDEALAGFSCIQSTSSSEPLIFRVALSCATSRLQRMKEKQLTYPMILISGSTCSFHQVEGTLLRQTSIRN
jgi:hypothetical protein